MTEEAIVRNKAVYFAAVGGRSYFVKMHPRNPGRLLTIWVTEAIRERRVEHFPVIVVIDPKGTQFYETIMVKEYS